VNHGAIVYNAFVCLISILLTYTDLIALVIYSSYMVICPSLIAVKYQVSVALSPESPCWNTEDCQHLAYVQREEGWLWTTVGFNALCLIYLRLSPCTLRTHPNLSDCIVRVLCVSL